MSRGSILSDRRNNRFDRPNQPQRVGKPPIVHLFTQKEEMPLLAALEQELANRSYEYRFHSDQKQLKPIVEAPLRKIYVVVSMEGNSSSLPSNYKVGSNKMVRICTLGGQGLGSPERPNFQRVEDVIRAIDDFTLQEPATIRLTSVHSIKVSKDKKGSSKDLKQFAKQVATNTYYDKAYYFKNYRGEYMPEEDKVYEDLVEQLEREGNMQPFKSARELEKKKQPAKNKKNLVLASANESSIEVIKELKKAKVTHFHFILLGRLNPCQQYLEDSVILASSDRRAIIDFLFKNNIINGDVANRLNTERMQPVGSKPESNKAVPYLQTTQSKIVPGESSKIEEEPQKKKIRKIKSPAKGRASNIEPEHPEHDTSHSSINVNIVVSKHKDEPIMENQEFYTNKQGERITKKQSIKEIDRQEIPQIQPYQSPGNYFDAKIESMNAPPSRFDAIAPAIENQFATKKASNIESKYRNPSVIIQEMSDEYRGSNKESIMNLEPEKPRTDQLSNVNEPLEEITIKKVVSKGPTYANQPETHYISSNRTIEYSKTNPAISDSNINATSTYQDYGNIPKYVSPGSPRVITGSPITISAGVASSTVNGVSNTRVYGRPAEGYQSPSRVIRKEVTAPEEIVDTEEKAKEENRVTFGSNFNTPPPASPNQAINYSNTLNYSNTNGNITLSNNYRAPQTISSSYNIQPATSSSSYNIQPAASSSNYNIQPAASSSSYNAQTATSSNYYTPQQTFNYHTLHNEPYNSKIHVTPGRVEQVTTNPQRPAQQVRNYTSTAYNNYLSSPKVEDKGTKQFVFNSDDYEQIQRDGRIVYRKKVPIEGAKYTPINYVSARVERVEKQEDDGSPAVKRYETSPLRREAQATTVYDYNRPNSPQTHTYDYNRPGNNTYSSKNYEVITVPYRTDDQNLGEMIESSHKRKSLTENTQTTTNSKPADNKNFVAVSYRNEDRSGISNYYKDTGVKVYGVSHPRVEVERVQQVQPKVQAANPIPPVITPNKQKVEPIKVNKAKQDQKGQLSPALTPKNALNESNWFSRMSQLHSDGSILRRNNIRFGVKLQKREQRPEGNSVVENKMVSGIFKLNDLNKKMALNRIIQGEEYIEEQREKYSHINPSLNRFHFLLQEDLDYLQPTITKYLLHSQDRVDSFTGVNSLFAALNTHSESFDLGFVFARQEEMSHINPALMPENYFLVSIEGEQGLLEINEGQRRVRVDQLRHFPLVQRIILDSQLYQYVAYRNSRPEVELLADKFVNSEFILEKIETAFTTEILDCYYYELPRMTRLYVLCDQSELPGLLAVVQAYSEVNPAFKPETCKLVCVLSNILGNDQLIMAHPTVTFISNPEEITHFRHILGYAHHYDAPDPAFLPIDHLYYHAKHVGLEQLLAAHYPGRFAASPFGKVAEVYSRVEKMAKVAIKNGHQPKVYLVLHESVNAEKVRVEYFTKIFMLGKAKVVQNKVIRVMNTEELLELLKK